MVGITHDKGLINQCLPKFVVPFEYVNYGLNLTVYDYFVKKIKIGNCGFTTEKEKIGCYKIEFYSIKLYFSTTFVRAVRWCYRAVSSAKKERFNEYSI